MFQSQMVRKNSSYHEVSLNGDLTHPGPPTPQFTGWPIFVIFLTQNLEPIGSVLWKTWKKQWLSATSNRWHFRCLNSWMLTETSHFSSTFLKTDRTWQLTWRFPTWNLYPSPVETESNGFAKDPALQHTKTSAYVDSQLNFTTDIIVSYRFHHVSTMLKSLKKRRLVFLILLIKLDAEVRSGGNGLRHQHMWLEHPAPLRATTAELGGHRAAGVVGPGVSTRWDQWRLGLLNATWKLDETGA